MKLNQLAEIVSGELVGKSVAFQGIAIDSRNVNKSQVFVALKGDKTDGHKYVVGAKKLGAAAAIVEDLQELDFPQIKVKSCPDALIAIGEYYRNQMHCPVVAITGSCGKTTTKAMLSTILSEEGRVLSSEKSFNTSLSVPVTLSRWDNQDFSVFEAGASSCGEIKKLADLIKPTHAIITNIEPAHIAGFGSLEGVAREKSNLISGIVEGGVAFLNADAINFEYCKSQAKVKLITFGIENKADVMAKNIVLDDDKRAYFDLVTDERSFKIHLSLLGLHQVGNALAAAAVALSLGVSSKSIQDGLSKVKPEAHRLTLVKGVNNSRVIDDAYNAIPTAVYKAVELLSTYSGKKILVIGDMKELDEADAESCHARVGRAAKDLGVDMLYGFGALSKNAIDAFGDKAYHFDDKSMMIDAIKSYADKNTTILVKASRSMRFENIVDELKG